MSLFERYTLTDKVEETSSTLLYRGSRVTDGAAVVVKLLRNEYPSRRELAVLQHEYALLRGLSCEGVTRALDLVRHGHGFAVVLEDPGGVPLASLLRVRKLEIDTAMRIAIALADSLAATHAQHVIHKDVQPANVFVDLTTMRVKLTNFAIATRLAQETAADRPPDALEGTLAYLSPEQTGRMNRAVDARADLYSFGVTLYEVLTGVVPFQSADPLELLHSHIARIPAAPDKLRGEIPPVLSAIVLKLLAKAAEDRYQSAAGVRADLEECLRRWKATGRIDPFPLGAEDHDSALRIPETLYGRQAEVAALLASFERVRAGRAELLLVTGEAGIGKSVLVHELHKPIARRGGFFVAGKFDLFDRTVPFSAISHAFGELVRRLLVEREEVLARFRTDLQRALGQSGQVLVRLVPELELLVGPQPPVPELDPTDAQHRFNLVIRRFLDVIATGEHPLVVFLDDLQWIDAASLELLQLVLTDRGREHLLVVGAYRDNELAEGHGLPVAVEAIERAGIAVTRVALGPLAERHVTALLADALQCAPERAEPLARWVVDKTHGNPFFLTQFVRGLYADGLIRFDLETRAFTWDLDAIGKAAVTDNVVAFMARKLERLPAATQRVLQLAACLGHRFHLDVLATIDERPPSQTAAALWDALREGVAIPEDADYRFFEDAADGALVEAPKLDVPYRFRHDRVQQAAYSLIDESERRKTHLRIGRLLRARGGEAAREHLFEIVRHLDIGAPLIEDPAERRELARLELAAAKQAKSAIAYRAAAAYVAAAMEAHEPSWQDDYELTFERFREAMECEYLSGRHEVADEHYRTLLANARGVRDRASVYNLRTRIDATAGRYADAVRAGIEGLRLFGIELPEDRDAQQAMLASAIGAVVDRLATASIDELARRPKLADPDIAAVRELLYTMSAPAYLADPVGAFALLLVEQVRLALEHGLSGAMDFVTMGLLCSFGGMFERGFELGKLAFSTETNVEPGDHHVNVNYVFGMYSHAGQHVRDTLRYFSRAHDAAEAAGDLIYLDYALVQLINGALALGEPLAQLQPRAEAYFSVIRRNRDVFAESCMTIALRFIANLEGQTASRTSFSGAGFDEDAFIRELDRAPSAYPALWFYALKLEASVLHGEPEAALAAADEANRRVASAAVEHVAREVAFYTALACCAAARADDSARANLEVRAAGIAKQLARWAEACPANFRHKHRLVVAELARLTGDELAALHGYDEAIAAASAHGYPRDAALANELAAELHLACGRPVVARAYLLEARFGYTAWGATAKVDDLDREYPELLVAAKPAAAAAVREPDLDLLSIAKATRTISSEIDLEKLASTLMRVVLEQSGAQRGCLIVARDEGLVIEATAALERGGIATTLTRGLPMASSGLLPESIVHYAHRTQTNVIVDDPVDHTTYASDPYLVRHQPRSVLCMPIVQQARVGALLYLEHGLVAGTFTASRLTVLELLSAQAAISLENALLVTRERASRELLQAVVDTSAAVVYVKDLDGRYLLVNRRFEELFKVARDAIVGKTDVDMFQRQQAAFRALDRHVIESGSVLDAEEQVPHEDGLHTYISVKSPLRDSTGRLYGVCCIATDITERKSLEAQLQQAQKMEAIGRLAGGIAHDFNNLLTAILGYSDFLAVRLDPASPLRKDAQEIRAAGQRAAALTHQLLAFSRRQVLEPKRLDLNAVVGGLSQMLQRLLGEDIDLAIRLAPDVWSVAADPSQLDQVVLNLAVNSRDAMPQGGTLTIETTNRELDADHARHQVGVKPGRYVVLTVTDTGTGIAADALGRIFDPFFTTKPPGKGTGLGLAMVHGIVNQSGGNVAVRSEPGRGTTFEIYLPAVDKPVEEPRPTRARTDGPRGTETILLVEDEPLIRHLAARILREQHYTVLEAANGADALRLASEHAGPIDLVITDVVMPGGVSGTQLVEQLGARRHGVKTLYMSGYTDEALQVHGVLASGSSFLKKPFTPGILTNKVREVLAQPT